MGRPFVSCREQEFTINYTPVSQVTHESHARYDEPGASRWLLDVFSYRHLLGLLLKKGITTRYYGSALGWLWSYIRPAAQFLMYYVMIGIVLGVDRGIAYFPVYLFSGIIVINFFTEAVRSGTNSVTSSAGLVKKIYLPRELFPVAAVGSAFIHFVPQVALLFIVCLIVGWSFSLMQLAMFLIALVVVFIFALGLALFFSALNVAFRDAKNAVGVILMFATWASPVLYPFVLIRDLVPVWLYYVYMVNPVTVAVELFHETFWLPVVQVAGATAVRPEQLLTNTLAGFGLAIGTLLVGQLVFRRMEGNFAQHL